MKKILIILLSASLLLTFTACSRNKTEVSDVEKSSVSTQVDDGDEDDEEETEGKDENITYDYQIYDELPGTVESYTTYAKYIFDTPSEIVKTASSGNISTLDDYFVIYDHYVKGGTETFDIDIQDIENVADVMTVMATQAAQTMSVGLIRADTYTVSVDYQEEQIIGSWDMCYFEGNVHLEYFRDLAYEDAKFVGYSVIKDDYPIYFAVVDSTEDQSMDIEEMKELAYKIATTFRNCELT